MGEKYRSREGRGTHPLTARNQLESLHLRSLAGATCQAPRGDARAPVPIPDPVLVTEP
jgi:hypothetical protein